MTPARDVLIGWMRLHAHCWSSGAVDDMAGDGKESGAEVRTTTSWLSRGP